MSAVYYALIIGLILGFNVVYGTHKDDVRDFFDELHHEDLHHHVNKFNSSMNQICKGYDHKINQAIQEIAECGDRIDDNKLTYCKVVENHLRNCTKPLTDVFEECLPKGLKDWPSFIIDMTLSIAKYVCGAKGQYIIELANPCIKSANDHTKVCSELVKKKFAAHGYHNLPTTQDVCRAGVDIRPCFAAHVQEACRDNITQEAYIGFYDALFKPCTHKKKD